MEHLFIDSTIVRAHQHSADAQKKQVARKSAARLSHVSKKFTSKQQSRTWTAPRH
jgi:hypothetical protein